jgi:GT2 family glycosyltransferase
MLKRDCVISFDTYYGSLSIDKWRKFTNVEEFRLRVEAAGTFEITIYSAPVAAPFTDIKTVAKHNRVFSNNKAQIFNIPDDIGGVVFFSLKVLSERAAFNSAQYEGELRTLNDVRIALNICTYKREDYIYKNMTLLNEHIFANSKSQCQKYIIPFIIDNGQTIKIESLPGCARLIYNKNTGGSGGYIRGMGEALNAPDGFTHIVMMDDDISLHPAALERLYAFLTCVKSEYSAHPIAGAMLNTGSSLQHEIGGSWCNTQVEVQKGGLELTEFRDVVFNEYEEPFEFGGWWFCCIPSITAKRAGLPEPFFIKEDDVEYGLRINLQPVTLNGICVWHEPFEHKYNAAMEYYIMRNALCVNARHRPGFTKRQTKKWIWRLYWSNILRYRYECFELILKGVTDFLDKSWIKKDPEALHEQILSMAPPMALLSERPKAADHADSTGVKPAGIIKKILIMLTLNGMILPLRDEAVVPAYRNNVSGYFRKKRVYNAIEGTNTGFWVTCDRKRAWRLLLSCIKVLRRF